MKKETLEEAFNKIVDSSDYVLFDYASFEEGAKWKQERSYSEEEVIELLTKRSKHFGTSLKPFDKILLKQDLEWFEQFKKK